MHNCIACRLLELTPRYGFLMPSTVLPKKQWEMSCKKLNKRFELAPVCEARRQPFLEPTDPLADALAASFSHYIKVNGEDKY